MAGKEEIIHPGKILEITPTQILVGIEAQSACSSCHASALCGLSESEQKIISVPASLKDYAAAEPVYEVFDGWQEDISNIRRFEDLPLNCQKYIRFIEEYCGTDIAMVSVSAEREGNIILKELL